MWHKHLFGLQRTWKDTCLMRETSKRRASFDNETGSKKIERCLKKNYRRKNGVVQMSVTTEGVEEGTLPNWPDFFIFFFLYFFCVCSLDYFAMGESRTELLAWINDLCSLNYTKIEQAGTGWKKLTRVKMWMTQFKKINRCRVLPNYGQHLW